MRKKTESPKSGKWGDDKSPTDVYEGKGSPVAKSAKKAETVSKDYEPDNKMGRKSGGRARHKTGSSAEGSSVAGFKAHGRADRPARKAGGICDSDWTAAQGKGNRRPNTTQEP